jgi:hypothetical protein
MEVKKMNKNTIFTLMALLFVGIAAAGIVSAYRGDPNAIGPNYNTETHELLQQALENRDYNMWISLREENNLPMKGKIFSVINEDNFGLFVDMHEARKEGDFETADAIRVELGLGQGMMKRGEGSQMGQGMKGKGMRGQNKGLNNNGNFADADNDGNCDNYGLSMGRSR